MKTGSALQQLFDDFTIMTDELLKISELFLLDMNAGLSGQPSSLAMLPSFLTKPCGQEKGSFLALDFGGTNVRVLLVELLGNGEYVIHKRHTALLVDPAGSYDYTASKATAEELFDFLAAQLAALTEPTQTYSLGHAFSFPCRLANVDNAVLLYWTKEIATSGVVGQNVVTLLNDALIRKNISNIRPAAVVNDSVSALMAAAYTDTRTDIGSICGTGHNTCYLEPNPPGSSQSMYVNMESGNFDKVQGSAYDLILDKNSDRPGAGRLEKMCSGRYIGEILRLVILDLTSKGIILPSRNVTLDLPVNSLSGKDVATLASDSTPDLHDINTWLSGLVCPANSSNYADRAYLRAIASCITTRSARLVAATYAATLRHIDPEMNSEHIIAIDGSLYEKMPGYADTIQATLKELLGDKTNLVRCKLSKDSSGVGAAVAAATIAGYKVL